MKDIKTTINKANDYFASREFEDRRKANIELERKRRMFVNHFNYGYMQNLQINEYVTNGTQTTFCYQLEWGLRELGSIKGSPATKYGVYSNESGAIKTLKKWEDNSNVAFGETKNKILNLLNYIQNEDFYLISQSSLPSTVKGKICFVYKPENFIPIYSEKHIDFFLETFGIPFAKNENYIRKNRLLLDFKNHTEPFSRHSNLEFMNFLYSEYGFKKETDELKHGIKYDFSNISVKKGSFEKGIIKTNEEGYEKEINFREMYENKLKIGYEAEMFVLKNEKQKFPAYAKKIKYVGNKIQKYHFDILSVNADGSKKHIEVKTKTDGGPNNVDFYLTSNEYKALCTDPNYVIYFVYDLKSNPQIIEITPDKIGQLSKYYVLFRYVGKFKND